MGRSWLPDRVVLRRGAIVGCAILVVWVTFRGFHIGALIDQSPLPHDIASVLWVPLLLSPLLLFGPAGFLGARRTGTLSGGLWAGLVTGLIASLTVPGDYLMRHFWIASLPDAFFTYAITAVVCMVVAGLGAAVAVLLSKGSRHDSPAGGQSSCTGWQTGSRITNPRPEPLQTRQFLESHRGLEPIATASPVFSKGVRNRS